MKSIRAMSAAVIALGLATMGTVVAMPQAPAPADSGDLVIKVQSDDCHAGARRHYLRQYDRRVWHRHRQSNCRAVLVDPPDDYGDDDDDDDGDRPPRDCHRDVRRHYLDEYGGNVTHRHSGDSCRVRVYRRDSGGDGDGVCVQIGPIQWCEN